MTFHTLHMIGVHMNFAEAIKVSTKEVLHTHVLLSLRTVTDAQARCFRHVGNELARRNDTIPHHSHVISQSSCCLRPKPHGPLRNPRAPLPNPSWMPCIASVACSVSLSFVDTQQEASLDRGKYKDVCAMLREEYFDSCLAQNFKVWVHT